FQDNDANHHLSREWRASPFGRNNTWCDTVYGVSQCREINILIYAPGDSLPCRRDAS
ncbi:hypothetical protein HHJ84_17040, partial [Photorhabdus heterorhabditis subsp. aluminescens]|nr:hypothetical protein [Photorhabdus heterorhabditis subsp. aluminescens]